MADIGAITGLDKKPEGVTAAPDELINQIVQIKNNEMYQQVDTAIFECIGKSLTFGELLTHIKKLDPSAYEYVIGHAQQILNPTYALS
jgi:hypothetical protein